LLRVALGQPQRLEIRCHGGVLGWVLLPELLPRHLLELLQLRIDQIHLGFRFGKLGRAFVVAFGGFRLLRVGLFLGAHLVHLSTELGLPQGGPLNLGGSLSIDAEPLSTDLHLNEFCIRLGIRFGFPIAGFRAGIGLLSLSLGLGFVALFGRVALDERQRGGV
jgi:hypothetical protein